MSKELPIAGKVSECACGTCANMCQRPCWPSPEESRKLMKAGMGHRLMLDYWDQMGGAIYILAPANKGYESDRAPHWPRTPEGCTFWSEKLCDLHVPGLKPLEGRLASCKDDGHQANLHRDVAKLWDTPEAEALVAEWKKDYY